MSKISIILPVHNEQDSLSTLHRILHAVCNTFKEPADILFVDDGSTDDTYAVLTDIRKRDSAVRVIRLESNYGQASALQAGFDHAEGDIIVTLDADLENDPNDIPMLLGKLEEGYDVVCGRRTERPRGMKRFVSKLGNLVFRLFFDVPVKDMACTLRVYKRGALDEIVIRGSFHRYLPVLLHMKGASIAEADVRYTQRKQGRSKYGVVDRMFSTSADFFELLFKRRKVLENIEREYIIKELW